jgi:hypothetical protein
MANGLIQVVAGVNVKYIDNVPNVLLGLKSHGTPIRCTAKFSLLL